MALEPTHTASVAARARAAIFTPSWRKSAAYGSIAFAQSALNNVFVTYYVELFTGIVRLTPFWFYFGQVVFM